MNFLNNIKVIWKIMLIIALLGGASVASMSFAAYRMNEIDKSYSELVNKTDRATLLAARSGRNVETYVSTAYQLLTETTDEGNKYLRAKNSEQKAIFFSRIRDAAKLMPQKSSEFETVEKRFASAFVECDPMVDAAAAASTVTENARVAALLKAKCAPMAQSALDELTSFVTNLGKYASQEAALASEQTSSTIRTVLIFMVTGLLVSFLVGMWISIKGLSQPIAELMKVMTRFAADDLTDDVPGAKRGDELGAMARTVEVFKTNGLEVRRMREEQRELEAFTAAQRKRDMIKLADDFENAVGEIIKTVSSASTELEASATSLTNTANRSQKIAVVVSAASEEASANVQSVAAATEEMASTVNEISRQVQESSRIANEAVEQATATNARVNALSEAASRIGDVVELITVIAGQTNLLALNATIEAARAGEAGRGFAVVASEVKALAEQTAKATGEISQQITGIQNATGFSVTAIKEIGTTIGKMSEIAAAIAAAVEEQGAATQEIARNVQQAALGTQEVSSNIIDVQRGTSETGSASSQVLSAAQLLSQDSNKLKVEVGRFLSTIRAA